MSITSATIADVMTREPVCVTPDASVAEVAAILDADEISGAPVVDGQGVLLGVVSRTDLLHYCLSGTQRSDRSFFESLNADEEGSRLVEIDPESFGVVEDFMSTELVTVSPSDTLHTVARRLVEDGIHRVIVTNDNGHVEGLVSTLDVIDALTR